MALSMNNAKSAGAKFRLIRRGRNPLLNFGAFSRPQLASVSPWIGSFQSPYCRLSHLLRVVGHRAFGRGHWPFTLSWTHFRPKRKNRRSWMRAERELEMHCITTHCIASHHIAFSYSQQSVAAAVGQQRPELVPYAAFIMPDMCLGSKSGQSSFASRHAATTCGTYRAIQGQSCCYDSTEKRKKGLCELELEKDCCSCSCSRSCCCSCCN